MTYGTADVEEPTGWRGFLVPIGVVLGLAGLIIGIWFLFDSQASANVAAIFYDLLGNPDGGRRPARWQRQLATSPSSILAAVALVVGVGGIWLFYAGLNAIVMRLKRPVARAPAALGLRRAGARCCSPSTWCGRSSRRSSSRSPSVRVSPTGSGP